MAGRVALTREEADTVLAAFKEAEAQILASPAAISERFRIAAMWKAREQGIE
jgi:long-subunit acyl-CoA synthetase (AMP-forming)